MNKFFANVFTLTLSIITLVFTFIPETLFESWAPLQNIPSGTTIVINRLLAFAVLFILVIIVYGVYLCIRRSICIKGHGYSIQIEYGNILQKNNCKKVINFDECLTTMVGDAPGDIKRSSICGQYLTENPIHNMDCLIKKAQLKPLQCRSEYQNKECYQSGKLVPNGDYLLMAFAKLDNDGRGCFFSRAEFLDCLSVLWDEIDKYYGQKDVCIPILGSGLTRFEGKPLTQQELLDIIIASYKLSPRKIKPPCQLRIVFQRRDDFSLNRIGDTL